jgi:hypothetical protein
MLEIRGEFDGTFCKRVGNSLFGLLARMYLNGKGIFDFISAIEANLLE